MKKSNSLIGLFAIYVGIIGFFFLINQLLFIDSFKSSFSSLLHAVAQVSLVDMESNGVQKPISFIIYSLISTQFAGTMWFTILLWYYWKLFDRRNQHSVKEALTLTIKTSVLLEGMLFVFFLYSLPPEASGNSMFQKLLTALALSITSFNIAGIAELGSLVSRDLIASNFLIQLGIIAGSSLGALGIFVINELLAPKNLRYRLAKPETDWSLITKTSVFGVIGFMSFFSLLFFLSEHQAVKENGKLIEALASSIFEVNSARGFGYYIFEKNSISSQAILWITSIFGAGPFSMGGGITLLFFPGLFFLLSAKRKTLGQDWKLSYSIVKNLLIYSLSTFGSMIILKYLLYENQQFYDLLYKQWMMFTSNGIVDEQTDMIDLLTILLGRMSFVAACYATFQQNKGKI